jgi:hypothetical protein
MSCGNKSSGKKSTASTTRATGTKTYQSAPSSSTYGKPKVKVSFAKR